jgi:hypothetical protein
MNKGAVLIARNNSQIDYTKQAIFCAKRIIEHLNIPVTLITDNVAYLNKNYIDSICVFDKILEISSKTDYHHKNYKDGLYSRTNLEFKNTSRCDIFDLTPYDQTLLMDTDFVVGNTHLKQAFEQNKDILMYDTAFDLAGWRSTQEFDYISPTSIKFYWATVVYFKKTNNTKQVDLPSLFQNQKQDQYCVTSPTHLAQGEHLMNRLNRSKDKKETKFIRKYLDK